MILAKVLKFLKAHGFTEYIWNIFEIRKRTNERESNEVNFALYLS